uniref:Transmembrane protein n=1 Tax=Zhangzhou Fusar tick virus 1 TaxID=2972101 RepID=A0A9E7V1T7_9VIRU|nr:MAG: hypothetical protein [Zhangzhou Fusar tick virus 1]
MILFKSLLHGWTLERDPITGKFIYGSVPRMMLDTWSEMKFWSKKTVNEAAKLVRRSKGAFVRSIKSFSQSHPRIALSLTAAAATIGYFVGVGVAWAVALKVLRLLRIFP